MKSVIQFMQHGFGVLDMSGRIAYHIVNNTRHASPRCAPGGFLVHGAGDGVQQTRFVEAGGMSLPRYAEYKDSGVEWLGEVPAHWRVTH